MAKCDCCGEDVANLHKKVRVITLKDKTFEVVDYICARCMIKEYSISKEEKKEDR